MNASRENGHDTKHYTRKAQFPQGTNKAQFPQGTNKAQFPQGTNKAQFPQGTNKGQFHQDIRLYLPVIHHILGVSNLQGQLNDNLESYRNCVHDAWNCLQKRYHMHNSHN